MTEQTKTPQEEVSALSRQFVKFCKQQDPDIKDDVLTTIEQLVNKNALHGDTCLDLRAVTLSHLNEQISDSTMIGQPGDYKPLIYDGHRLYLHRHWREEQIITHDLKTRMVDEPCETEWLKKRLDDLFDTSTEEKEEQTLGQKIAAAMALTSRLAIITGGPGTGKTTTVTKILALLLEQQKNTRILLAAPTGKAATRLAESISEQIETTDPALSLHTKVEQKILDKIPRQASTVHRLLGLSYGGFKYNADNHLPCDCLLLDETSMIDQGLMANLLQALPPHCRLILLGDRDQLESVEAGRVLGDITGHGKELSVSPQRAETLTNILGTQATGKYGVKISDDVPAIADYITQLQFSHRFSKGGGIGKLADAVNKMNIEDIKSLMSKSEEQLNWIETNENSTRPSSKIIQWAVDQYSPVFDANSAEEALTIFESARLLTALRQGPWGETRIGEQIETQLRNAGHINEKQGEAYKGLPIIIRNNDRETGLFNGDTGIFWPYKLPDTGSPEEEQTEGQQKTLMAHFQINGEMKTFSIHQLPKWQPAWTLTVHRSQGSQYSNVLLVLPPKENKILSRELIYTGLTRAAKRCTIVMNPEHFTKAIAKKTIRLSGMSERLGWTSDQVKKPED